MKALHLSGKSSWPPCVLLASLSAVWFIWIVAFDAFVRDGVPRPAFEAMLDLAPQYVWTAAVAVLTVVHIVGISYRPFRRAANLTASMFWLFVAVTFFIGSPQGVGAPTYMLIAAGAAWAYLRA